MTTAPGPAPDTAAPAAPPTMDHAAREVVGVEVSGEAATLLGALAERRFFLRHTVRGLTDAQARQRSTVSELCLGGLVKHVAAAESGWAEFMVSGSPAARAAGEPSAEDVATWHDEFVMGPDETVDGLLARLDAVARRTEEIVVGLPDLDVAHPLPPAPWFTPGAQWSARRVLLHLLGETAQHAGHADVIRESIDGQKTMS